MTTPIKIISKEKYLKDNKEPNQEKIWNNIAKPWKTYVVKRIPDVEKFLEKISKTKKQLKIIDLGCGTGRNLIPYENVEYTAIDFSSEQLKHAKELIKKEKINAKTICCEADNLSVIPSETFDHGLFIACLHCIESKEKRERALKEFYRVLKPNAKALITTWNPTDKRFNHVKNHGDIYMAWRENEIPHMRYYYLYEKQELIDLIKSTGFKITKFTDFKKEEKDRFNKKNWRIYVKKN